MISKFTICGFQELEQYVEEITEGILDFEVEKGNWKYTYHDRMVNYPLISYMLPKINYLNQIQFVIDELKRNAESRRAVIDIRNNKEDAYSQDPACLQHIQFFIRNNKLDMKVLFRSNDACKATFMNMFALVMLQKQIADILNIEVGSYTHRANSFHCYAQDYNMLEGYINNIISNQNNTYNYIDNWKELMEESKNIIQNNINILKGKYNNA